LFASSALYPITFTLTSAPILKLFSGFAPYRQLKCTNRMHYHGIVVKGFARTPGQTAILVVMLSDTNDDRYGRQEDSNLELKHGS